MSREIRWLTIAPSPRQRPAFARWASFGGFESAEAHLREGGREGRGEGASPRVSEFWEGPLTRRACRGDLSRPAGRGNFATVAITET